MDGNRVYNQVQTAGYAEEQDDQIKVKTPKEPAQFFFVSHIFICVFRTKPETNMRNSKHKLPVNYSQHLSKA